MKKKLVMFVLEGCPYCKKAKEALEAKGMKYKEIEVPSNKPDRELLKQISGQDSVPVLLDVIGAKDQDDDIIEWLEKEN
jgi:glutaredoxin